MPKHWLLGEGYPRCLIVHQQRYRPIDSNKNIDIKRISGIRRDWRYQREVIRIRISKKNRQHKKSTKVQKDKQRSTNHIHKTKDRITSIRYSQSQIFYKYLGARKPKSLNRIAKIAYVLLCLREVNFSFNNNNMI